MIPVRNKQSIHIFHQYTIKLKDADRNSLKEFLSSHGIPAMIYYPFPLHLQNAYKSLGYQKGDFPITEELSNIVLSLPMHTELTDEQLKFIASKVLEFTKK